MTHLFQSYLRLCFSSSSSMSVRWFCLKRLRTVPQDERKVKIKTLKLKQLTQLWIQYSFQHGCRAKNTSTVQEIDEPAALHVDNPCALSNLVVALFSHFLCSMQQFQESSKIWMHSLIRISQFNALTQLITSKSNHHFD